MAEWLYENRPELRRAYVFRDDSLEYSKATADYFKARWLELGGEVCGEDTFVGGPDLDLSSQVTRLRGEVEGCDFVYDGSWQPYGSQLVRAIRDAGMDTWIVTNASVNGTLVTEVAGNVSNFLSLGFACLPTYCEGSQSGVGRPDRRRVRGRVRRAARQPLRPAGLRARRRGRRRDRGGRLDGGPGDRRGALRWPGPDRLLRDADGVHGRPATGLSRRATRSRSGRTGSTRRSTRSSSSRFRTSATAARAPERRLQPGRRKENRPYNATRRTMNDTVDGSARAKLVAEGLHVHFEGVRAVDGIDLTLEQGQIMGLIGPNGAGKTTFMNAVSGFVPLTAGTVTMEGQTVSELSPPEARPPRARAHVPGRRHVPGAHGLRERRARRARRRPEPEARSQAGLGADRRASASTRRAPAGLGAPARRGAPRRRRPRGRRSARSSCCSTSRPPVSTTPRAWR